MELKIIKNTPTKPYYTLILEYMLGDSVVSGIHTSIDFNESDEDIKNFITVLEKLKGKRLKRKWGWMWNDDNYREAIEEDILNEAEISFYIYDGYQIIYTDENGHIYLVEVCL